MGDQPLENIAMKFILNYQLEASQVCSYDGVIG